MEKNELEQHYAIKFCVKLEEGATDTYGKFRKRLVMIFYHVTKYFRGTGTL
jgi:hypothetical protein